MPPAWLHEQQLILTPPNRPTWYRCAWPARPLFDWDNRPTSRYSSPSLPYRSLYLAEDTPTGFWEAYGDDLLDREPEMRSIPARAYRSRVIVRFQLPLSLQLVDLTDIDTLRIIGADGATFMAPYGTTQAWADALMRHPESGDGLIYDSRLNNGRRCLALFEKPGCESSIAAAVLHEMADDPSIRMEMIRQKIAVALES